jgi:glutathione S-transferase
MKLFYSPTSPYVRKVLITAFELGLHERIEKVPVQNSPVQHDASLNQANPIGKIPALITDDGLELYDSPVICEYLDSLHQGPKLFPDAGPARWEALRQQALADGVMDAAVLVRYETWLRPAELRWPDWTQGQTSKIERGLDVMESELASFEGALSIGTVSFACALGYLDLRLPDLPWRDSHLRLASWLVEFGARPSFQTTRTPG